MPDDSEIIYQTKKWITDVVIGCNFCPFANQVVKQNAVEYLVEFSSTTSTIIDTLLVTCKRMDAEANIETSFIILPEGCGDFLAYLDIVEIAERKMNNAGYEGVYQLASFHPKYLFAHSKDDDAANYTNRSPYPMLHILREGKIEEALMHYKSPEKIPERNIVFANEKGIDEMKNLLNKCLIASEE